MSKLLLTPFLAILVALLACSSPIQVPETPAPTKTPAPSSTQMPEATPVPTEAPTERPTAAPRATPASSPKPAAPADTPTQTPMSVPMDQAPTGAIAPLSLNDPEAALAELSEHEKDCLRKADDTGNPVRALGAAGRAAMAEQAKLISCLEDETVGRIFLAGFVGDSGPLSQETSSCVRTVFRVIDPRGVMTAGLDGNPQAAMAGSMAALSVTIACLTDEEWTATAPRIGMRPQEREAMQCLMETLGGPREMATAMRAAQEGHFTDLTSAGADCGLDMGSPPGQTPTGPSPTPTPTPTPVPIPTHVNQVPSEAQDIPALTDDQVTKMNESISGDPLLTVMLQGGYAINDYGPWVAGDRTFIGAIAEIILTTPTDYQGSLPMVGFDPAEDGSKEYRSKKFNITASGIKSLFVLVDIAEEEVVGIEIGESDTLTLSTEGE